MNSVLAARAFGPAQAVVSAVLVVLAATLPGVPARSFTVLAACSSFVGWFLVRRFVPPSRQPLAHRSVDAVIAAVAALVVSQYWVIALIVALAFVLTTTSLELATPRWMQAAVFALGAAPGLLHVGSGALPAIAIAAVLAFIDVWWRELLAMVSVQDRDALRQALETSASLVHISNMTKGRTVSLQGPVQDITGYTIAEWTTLDHRTVFHPDDVDDFWLELENVLPGQSFDRKARLRHKDGHWVWVRDLSVVTREADGNLYLRGFTIDITEIERAHEVIRRQAETDSLTGLSNRSVLLGTMERLCEQNQPFALLLMDLDRFKLINDTMGHHVGDEVLKEVARRIEALAGEDDLVCRLGGDEFAVVARGLSLAEADELADRIHAETTRPIRYLDVNLRSGTSIGLVLAERPDDTPNSLLRRADLAMYRAKSENSSHLFFADEMVETSVEDLRLAAELPRAIRDDQLELFFQSKVDLSTGEIVGFEGLARWCHPEHGVLGPHRFLHLVTVSNQEDRFVDLVIEKGVAFAAACQAAGRAVPIAINLSTSSFLDDTLPAKVHEALNRHGVAPALFVIEITEIDIIEKMAASAPVLDRWTGLGIGISVDDFGTGYASFARLVDMPITEVKIDRRFVQGAPTNRQDEIIVRSITDLARRMNIGLIAEGVETPDQAKLLLDAGCQHAQGFLYSRPVPRDEALALLTPASYPMEPAAAS